MGDGGYDLDRFVRAQEPVYAGVLAELRAGRKRGHWMWFVFPQVAGLGQSETARYYAISSREEAAAYLAHPVLGPRLAECTGLVLAVEGRSAADFLGYPDDLKLRSSMTLFAEVAPDPAPYRAVLDRYFDGAADDRTLALLTRDA
ncbi:DUF1810 domain-containing protein [Phytohabitans houttuyneae]|uniref:Calpastatin n=1 Tax=Phytohabitans houttuyneae TaxID=1076126 RepID=A0A6V8KDE9_9ACTN|nr:DUF1810 domain-containing protein [Phytohabitans houttuyneae]GFJ83243.1 hypothetical protein Phou_074230 [Phytohabitans houttuyneae]